MRLSGRALATIGIVTAVIVILFMTTSSHQRESYYHYSIGLMNFKMKKYDAASNRFSKSYGAWQDNLMAFYFKLRSDMIWSENLVVPDQNIFRKVSADAAELIKKGTGFNHENLNLFYYVKAWAHYDLREWDTAYKYVKDSLDLKPTDFETLILAGRIQVARGEFLAAVSLLEQAVDINSMRPYKAYFYLGEAYETNKDPDKAWYYYDKCLKGFPNKKLKAEAIKRKTELVSKSPAK